eukprot:13961-Heterococcus_DN1.PRE.2
MHDCKLHNSGVSGPAALKLSAFGARELHDNGYKGQLKVNWVRAAVANEAEALEAFKKVRINSARREVSTFCPLDKAAVPKRLWKALTEDAGIGRDEKWGECGNAKIAALAKNAAACILNVKGKGAFKDEFVTCGGLSLNDINMKGAWSLSYVAGHAIGVHATAADTTANAKEPLTNANVATS